MTDTSKFQDEIDGMRSALRRASEEVAALSVRARKAGQQASAAVAEFADEAGAQGRKAARYAVREVREHPGVALAVGAAIGLVVTALLMRRR
jgi:ElaB/YqjD/DUF883 family membrane-anchored ribosome-binding protein